MTRSASSIAGMLQDVQSADATPSALQDVAVVLLFEVVAIRLRACWRQAASATCLNPANVFGMAWRTRQSPLYGSP